MENKKMVECLACKGRGEVCDVYDSAFGTWEYVWHECGWCNGIGKLEEDDEVLTWMEPSE